MGLGIKHQGLRRFVMGLIGLVVLGSIYFAYTWYARQHPAPADVILHGQVTRYDPTPSYVDGLIIFEIDGQPVDIGGGERPDNVMGSVYSPIKVGDKVDAKVRRAADGSYTIVGCKECYVREHADL